MLCAFVLTVKFVFLRLISLYCVVYERVCVASVVLAAAVSLMVLSCMLNVCCCCLSSSVMVPLKHLLLLFICSVFAFSVLCMLLLVFALPVLRVWKCLVFVLHVLSFYIFLMLLRCLYLHYLWILCFCSFFLLCCRLRVCIVYVASEVSVASAHYSFVLLL